MGKKENEIKQMVGTKLPCVEGCPWGLLCRDGYLNNKDECVTNILGLLAKFHLPRFTTTLNTESGFVVEVYGATSKDVVAKVAKINIEQGNLRVTTG